MAVDPSFLYWESGSAVGHVGRVPVGGGATQAASFPAGTTSGGPCGVAVNSQFVFWGNPTGRRRADRTREHQRRLAESDVDRSGASDIRASLAAAPSNKITINSVAKNKKKGTATINSKVSGPGQVTLNQTNTPPDVNAVAPASSRSG